MSRKYKATRNFQAAVSTSSLFSNNSNVLILLSFFLYTYFLYHLSFLTSFPIYLSSKSKSRPKPKPKPSWFPRKKKKDIMGRTGLFDLERHFDSMGHIIATQSILWICDTHVTNLFIECKFWQIHHCITFFFLSSMFVKFLEDQKLITMSSIKHLNFKFL